AGGAPAGAATKADADKAGSNSAANLAGNTSAAPLVVVISAPDPATASKELKVYLDSNKINYSADRTALDQLADIDRMQQLNGAIALADSQRVPADPTAGQS